MQKIRKFLSNPSFVKASKIFLILVVPLVLTIVNSHDKDRYEFVIEDSSRMVAPTAPHPYLSLLFSDTFQQFGTSWHKFCIQNNSYSKKQDLPHDLAYRVGDTEEFSKISYGETDCVPIRKDDVFYDVAWGGFEIPNKEKAEELCESTEDGRCIMKFDVNEAVNFDVYSKLSGSAAFVIYILFVAAVYGFISLILSVYDYIFVNEGWYSK
ncbi:hypothetical protein A2765_05305 [Candidatus Kaiserbacteria bacterium RIFCSPHIGHO2_01_FULL_56_24]|uniref:Uncharacterized protein n=1 Tax=Candidatus Kaiserbacteria bacterium RIFCSPHIGHO2_01_FULL_56_24 TaxID=1798487 RepID=A0A1F6DGX8_9BACT|nr:MAG: hypothetical protein A2765_05305 [Candidatus Kaiserbacteria bacterium RIFCSPHIGHO2_01_FULL_56_24]